MTTERARHRERGVFTPCARDLAKPERDVFSAKYPRYLGTEYGYCSVLLGLVRSQMVIGMQVLAELRSIIGRRVLPGLSLALLPSVFHSRSRAEACVDDLLKPLRFIWYKPAPTDMYDPSVFAVLIPANHMAQIAFALDHNAKYLVRAISGVAVNPPPSSRESTPAPQSPFDEVRDLFTGDTDPFVTVDRIVLHFSHMDDLIDPVDGIRFGTRPRSSDVLLGHLGTPGVSAHHFSIVVDDNLRVWLHDHSRYGCAVAYDGEGRDQTRRNDTWVLGYEPGHPRRWREVIVHVASGIAFRVEFPHHHEAAPPEYVTRLQAFRARCRGAAPSIGVLGLGGSSASTTAPSSARTPGNKAVYLDDGCIGKGAFGDVRRVIKARDGHVYALKKAFHREERGATNKRRRDSEQSRNEYDIMTMDPHVSRNTLLFLA